MPHDRMAVLADTLSVLTCLEDDNLARWQLPSVFGAIQSSR